MPSCLRFCRLCWLRRRLQQRSGRRVHTPTSSTASSGCRQAVFRCKTTESYEQRRLRPVLSLHIFDDDNQDSPVCFQPQLQLQPELEEILEPGALLRPQFYMHNHPGIEVTDTVVPPSTAAAAATGAGGDSRAGRAAAG